MISIVAGPVVFFVPVTTNQPTAHSTDHSAYNSALAAANNGSGYDTRATTNGRAFSLVTPTFFGGLSLGRRAAE